MLYQKAVLYDAMRHFFFVYPSIIILAGLSFNYVISALPKNLKYVSVGATLLLIALPRKIHVRQPS